MSVHNVADYLVRQCACDIEVDPDDPDPAITS
jgi:hypothetical protein